MSQLIAPVTSSDLSLNLSGLPAIVLNSGDVAAQRFLEFFAVTIRNPHTRSAYMRAVSSFLAFLSAHGVAKLDDITPMAVAGYIEDLGQSRSIPTTKQHLAAIRMLCDYLVRFHILPDNPAAAVTTRRLKVTTGATPYREPSEVRRLFEAIDGEKITDYRDRALIGCMAYTFARVSAVLAMDVKDIYTQGRTLWVRLREKNGVQHAMPCHHQLAEYLDAYLDQASLRDQANAPLFQSATRARTPALTGNRLRRENCLHMVKRRAVAAGLPADTTNHTFRATGITTFLENGGSIEDAQHMAAHASLKTTQVYDRRKDTVTVENVERLRY